MTSSKSQPTLLVIGNNATLVYLFTRFAEQSGCQIIQRAYTPWVDELRQLKPVALIFASLQDLQTAQTLIEDMTAHETLVLVCASLTDELRAKELGADICLFHPLTYENFLAALSAVYPASQTKSRFQAKTSGFQASRPNGVSL